MGEIGGTGLITASGKCSKFVHQFILIGVFLQDPDGNFTEK